MISESTAKPIIDSLTPRWIQIFMQRYNIFGLSQCGKLKISPQAQEGIERNVVFFIGGAFHDFSTEVLDETVFENADESHFVVNIDNRRTICFRSDKDVRYADITSREEGITMVVGISGGPDARIENKFKVFKNKDMNYPIRDVEDDVPGVCYRTGSKY